MLLKVEKNIELGLGKWIVTVDPKIWKKHLVQAENNLVANYPLPGFRKGKSPAKLVLREISANPNSQKDFLDKILKNATKSATPLAYKFALAEKSELELKSEPKVEVITCTKEELVIAFVFDLPVEIELGKYRGLKIAKDTPVVQKEEIDNEIKALKEKFAVYSEKPEGENLANGDVAIIDFVGILDGKEFANGSAKNQELEIGSNKFIPGFEEQMIGMKLGETRTIKLTFPEDYHVEELKGKDVEFKIDLNEIKIKTITEDEEELVKDINNPEINSYAELVVNIEQQILMQKNMKIREQFMEELFLEIVKESKIVIPNSALQTETERLLKEFKKQLEKQGFSYEVYKNATGLSDEEIWLEVQKDANMQLKNFLILEEIIKKEQLVVNDEEVESHLKTFAEQFKITLDEVKKNIKDLAFVSSTLKRNKAFDLLWENNGQENVTE